MTRKVIFMPSLFIQLQFLLEGTQTSHSATQNNDQPVNQLTIQQSHVDHCLNQRKSCIKELRLKGQ